MEVIPMPITKKTMEIIIPSKPIQLKERFRNFFCRKRIVAQKIIMEKINEIAIAIRKE
jgi:hypothetical protein